MKQPIDAYRYFFPAGWILGLWGVILWLLFPWGLVTYPGLQHPEIMTGGFFLCFVAGFLMTAAPKFTDTYPPTAGEHLLSSLLIGALLITAVWFTRSVFYGVVFLIFIFLLRFVMVRFFQRKGNPPSSFVFLGFGLISGLLASLVAAISEFTEVPLALRTVSRIFFMQGYVMCLVVGVGSRLVPALLGFAPLPTDKGFFKQPQVPTYIVLAFLFCGSYFLEVLVNEWWGVLCRTFILGYIFIFIWHIHRLPVRKAAQTYGLWVAAWSVFLGHLATVFFISYRVHILHVILICGLALMTLMIAVRVSLSHGKHDMVLEKKSKALIVAALLIFLAGLTRLSAGFAPAIYQSHLLYAAATWVLGLLIWGVVFIPRVLQVRKPS